MHHMILTRAILVVTLLSSAGFSKAIAQTVESDLPKWNTDAIRGLELRNLASGFKPGRIADIAVDSRDRSTWYVATASSGLWKTTNRGTSWTPIFDDHGSYSLGCVVIDPRDSNVIWLGTGENQSLRSVSFGDGLYKSTNAGRTWTRVGLHNSEHIAKILIDPRDSNVVLVACQGPLWAPGGDRGLYKTTDGGQTWAPILTVSENTGITDVIRDPRNPDVLIASAYQRRRHVGLLIGGGPEAGILKSTDGGQSWTRLREGLPTVDMGRIALAFSPHNPDIVYAQLNAAGNEWGFYRSANGGETWVRQGTVRIQDPQFYGEIYADPHQFERVYVLDMRIQVTDDGGQTFRAVNWNMHVDNHALTFDPTDEDYLLVGNDGGLYETYDGGETWRAFTNMPTQQFYRVGISNDLPFYYIYGGAQDNGTQGAPSRTTHRDGIRTSDWINVGGGDGMQPRVDPDEPSIVYTQSQNAAITRMDKRTDASVGIRPRPPEDEGPVRWNWDTPLVVSRHAPQRIYLAGSRLFRSDNRGAEWRAISPDLTRQIDRDTLPVMGKVWGPDAVSKNTYTTAYGVASALAESPRVDGLLYFGTDDGLVQVTEDGGESWQQVDVFPGIPEKTLVSDLCASAHDDNVVYAAFNNYLYGDFQPYLLRSSDRGMSWESIAGNLPARHFVWSVIEDPVNKNLLFAGTEFGLFVTIDGGKSWAQIRSGAPTTAFRDLEIHEREVDLVAATFGRGFLILDDYSALRHIKPEVFEQEATLLPLADAWLFNELNHTRAVFGNSSSPNPPFGATISYFLNGTLPADMALSLNVTNADGREIRRLNAPNRAGLNRVVWDLRGPGAGGGRRGGRGGQQDLEEQEVELNSDEEEELEEAGQQPGEPAQAQEQEQEERVEAQPQREGQPERGQGGERQGRGRGRGRGGRGGGRGGGAPLVQAGLYKVTLNKVVEGEMTPIGASQEFHVAPLPAAKPAAPAATVAP